MKRQAKLVGRSLLFREWEITDGEKTYLLAYDGMGLGSECIRRDRVPIVKSRSHFWFVPRFDFEIDGVPCRVDVRIWPWLGVRALRLTVEEQVLYAEGASQAA